MTDDEQVDLWAEWAQQRSLARRKAREEERSDRIVCALVAVLMVAWGLATHFLGPWWL